MANPQKENGHIQVSTELWEALTKTRINGEARQILDFIIRKTYGFNKKEDTISLSQFCLGTGLHKSAVCKGVLKLKSMNLITQKVTSIASSYSFNKDFDTWKPLPKRGHQSPKGKSASHQKVNKRNPKGDTQYTVTKDTLTKDISEPSPRTDTQELFKLFYETINPNINFANKTDRKAADWLIEKYGLEKTISAAKYAISIQGDKYSPTITTPYQLKEKMAALAKHKSQKEISPRSVDLNNIMRKGKI